MSKSSEPLAEPRLEPAVASAMQLVASLAARFVNAPIAFIQLERIEANWASFSVGVDRDLAAFELPDTDEAMCSDGVFMQTYDATEHPIPGVRFFAAIPIVGGGTREGTIGILDTRPRTLGPLEIAALETLRPVIAQVLCSSHIQKYQAAASADAFRPEDSQTEQLARFSEHLRELQRLSVTPHNAIQDLYADYLDAGCAMFRLSAGRITSLDGTVVCSRPSGLELGEPVLSTPIPYDGRQFGTLAFGSTPPAEGRRFSPQEQDVLELMARGIGHALHTQHLQQERAELNRDLARQLRRDALTDLSNRLGLFEWLQNALLKCRDDDGLAFLFIDLDQFKQINDTLGHAAGDELLRQVARRLGSCVEHKDQAARIGGDEFALVLAGTPDDDAIVRRARELLDVLREPYVIDGYELFITASIGISVYPRDGADATTLIQRSDAAMYRAKSDGKNDFQFYTTKLAVRTLNRLDLETQLRRAIDNGELDLRFQPILHLDGPLDGLEALLVWDNPKLGNVGPSRFIPVAEESGMIVSIGLWVLRKTCAYNMQWKADGYAPVRISVNVSALQFARKDFVDFVAEALEDSGMPPQCLELELTESLVMRDVDESARRMHRLRDLGVSMSIDDFGTGYSSLGYLRRLPVDTLKIDRSFVADLVSTKSSLPVIQAIVVLARTMGLSVVAEGVETEEQLRILRNIGCDRVQGFLFGEPLRADAVPRILMRRA